MRSESLFFLLYDYALQHWYLEVVTIFGIFFAHYYVQLHIKKIVLRLKPQYLNSYFYVHIGFDSGQVLLGNRLLSDPVWTSELSFLYLCTHCFSMFVLLFYMFWDWLFNSHGGGNHLISTLIKGEIRWFTPKNLFCRQCSAGGGGDHAIGTYNREAICGLCRSFGGRIKDAVWCPAAVMLAACGFSSSGFLHHGGGAAYIQGSR